MNREILIGLLCNGMKYPVGRHQIWISRCFEITVRPDRTVEIDEYEAYDERNGVEARSCLCSNGEDHVGTYHIGRTAISLKDKRVIREAKGKGWIESDEVRVTR